MKKAFLFVLSVVVFSFVVFLSHPLVFAGHGNSCSPGQMDKNLKKMSKKFNLTSEQQTEIKKIMEENNQKMMEVMEKSEKMMDEYNGKVREVLKGEQKAKFDKMQNKNKNMKCCM